MLLKNADDKSKRIALLNDLQSSPKLSLSQKKWVRTELAMLRKGIQGERESAHYLDSYLKDGVNHVVMHDLRFVVDGDVVQIDHLVINRGVGMYLIETKNYAGSMSINAYGEFTADYDGERFGIASPIEQSHRHERLLSRLLEKLDINMRMGKGMQFHHVVMLHPKAIIERPPADKFDTSMVIKADQFPSWHQKFVDKEFGLTKFIQLAANMRSLETIKEWGEKLVRQHRPADLLALPDFMKLPDEPAKPVAPASTAAPQTTTAAPKLAPFVAARPVPAPVSAPAPAPVQKPAPAAVSTQEQGSLERKRICAHCGSKISFEEGKFCWNNTKRFGGLQYCREHQALF